MSDDDFGDFDEWERTIERGLEDAQDNETWLNPPRPVRHSNGEATG